MTQLLHRPRPSAERREVTWRVLTGVALGPAVSLAALLAAVVLVVQVVGDGNFEAAAAITSAVWLAAHQVSLTIDGQPLGVLPLLPTLLLGLATARSVRVAVRQSGWSGDRVLWLAAVAVAGPVVVALLAVTLLAERPSLLPVGGVSPGPAIAGVVLVHGVGAAIGAAGPSGRWARTRDLLPGWAWRGLVLAPRALLVLLCGGALLVALSLVAAWSTVAALYGVDPSPGAVLGLTLVSLLYLPNLVVGATSVAVGPGLEVGRSTVTAFGTVAGPIPPLPLLGGIPPTSSSWVWLLVLVVPALAAVVLGVGAARGASDPVAAVRATLTAAGVSGVVLAVVGWFAGGRLGAGVFDPVSVPAGLLGALAAAWLGLVGAGTAGLVLHREANQARWAAEDAVAEQPREDVPPEGDADADDVTTELDEPDAADDSNAPDAPDDSDPEVTVDEVVPDDSVDTTAPDAEDAEDTTAPDAEDTADLDSADPAAANPAAAAPRDTADAAAPEVDVVPGDAADEPAAEPVGAETSDAPDDPDGSAPEVLTEGAAAAEPDPHLPAGADRRDG